MKRKEQLLMMAGGLVLAGLVSVAAASDAETSAQATGGRGPSGSALATARYEGDVGFARTDTRSGRVNLARGVALGFDADGLSLSLSTALAPRSGPALATTFNISIGTNGEVAHSVGTALATGGTARTVAAGGSAATARHGGTAVAAASGRTQSGGTVRVATQSEHVRIYRPAPVVRFFRPR